MRGCLGVAARACTRLTPLRCVAHRRAQWGATLRSRTRRRASRARSVLTRFRRAQLSAQAAPQQLPLRARVPICSRHPRPATARPKPLPNPHHPRPVCRPPCSDPATPVHCLCRRARVRPAIMVGTILASSAPRAPSAPEETWSAPCTVGVRPQSQSTVLPRGRRTSTAAFRPSAPVALPPLAMDPCPLWGPIIALSARSHGIRWAR